MHGRARGRPTEYGTRLREKQRCKRFYGLMEGQFRRVFNEASRLRGNTGEHLLNLLERRLDNVLTVCGFALSRSQARQLVSHGHFQVNGKKVDIPSYVLNEGDVVRPEPKDSILAAVRSNRESLGHPARSWLEINDADLTVRVARMPARDEVSVLVEDTLI